MTSESEVVKVRARVGIPVQERLLTDVFMRHASSILRAGPGRSTYAIPEAEIGAGRPDVVLVAISTNAVDAIRRGGLRLASPLAARALDLKISADDLGVTLAHARSVRRQLRQDGWFDGDPFRTARLVKDSLAVEAKLKDWRRAVRQVSRFRTLFHQSAVVMPRQRLPKESDVVMDFYGCGLLFEADNEISWFRPAVANDPPAWAAAWLVELLVRGLEDGSAQRLSSSRNSLIASR